MNDLIMGNPLKEILKAHIFVYIDKCSDEDFEELRVAALKATGVLDAQGELTEEWQGESVAMTALEINVPIDDVILMIGKELDGHMLTGSWKITRRSIEKYKEENGGNEKK